MKDKVQEIYDSLQERLKSPFLLTYIIVWVIHHWRLAFIVFSFDEELKQGQKKSIIEAYIKNHGDWCGMILPSMGWTLVSILAYYLLTLIYESIAIGYNRAKAWLYIKLNETRKTKTIEEFNVVDGQRKRLQKRVDDIEKRNAELSVSIENREKEHVVAIAKKDKFITDMETLDKERQKLSAEHIQIVNSLEAEKTKLIAEKETLNSKILQLENKNRLPTLDDILGTEIMTVFGNSTWTMEWEHNDKNFTEIFSLKGLDKFATEFGDITITDFKYNGTNRNVHFKKTNHQQNIVGLPVNLIVVNQNLMIGVEGDGASVTYTRVLK